LGQRISPQIVVGFQLQLRLKTEQVIHLSLVIERFLSVGHHELVAIVDEVQAVQDGIREGKGIRFEVVVKEEA
jgi:hypothetical protein